MLVLAAAGCTPGSVRSGGYAGMDKGEAQREVVDYARQEMIARTGPLTRHRLQLQRLYRGKTSKGDDAWATTARSTKGRRLHPSHDTSLLTVVIGVVAAIAALVWLAGGTSAHRAFTLVFYAGGACLLLFALLTSGAEGRGPSDRAINPTGALVLAAVGTLALGVVFEALL